MDEIIKAKRQQNAGTGLRAITIRGAREHNLKNVDLEIPRDKLVVFTGLSGSGKSSLAFDTIYAEGQRRYVESLSAYARQFLEMMQKPDVDQIDGLSPAISIEQKTTSKNPRSTVGTVTEIYDYMRLLWARVGIPYSPATGLLMEGAVDLDPLKTLFEVFGEFLAVLALAAAHHRRQQIEPCALGQRQHAVDHLRDDLALDRQAGRGRIGNADPRP
jgi:excinuclease UvrABC ATPase subunit